MNRIRQLLNKRVKKDTRNPSDTRIKLVAIAKDEASYFAEWVHHHLYFGFDDIEIHINRTSDNSKDVLNSICKRNPELRWYYADWIDKCPQDAKKQIQFIVYNKVWDECLRQGNYTHIFFLDIDEFWIPQDFSTNIHDYLKDFDRHDVISFEWLNDLGTLPAFSSIPECIEGNLSPLVKTIYPIATQIKELRHHVALMAGSPAHMLADKQGFKPRENLIQAVHCSLQSLKNAFIYHRANRSIEEYISLLYRGRPGDTFPYKTNRFGLPTPDVNHCVVNVDNTAYCHYSKSLQKFMDKCLSTELIREARKFVEHRFEQSMQNLKTFVDKDYDIMMQMFRGVYDHRVVAVFQEKRAALALNQKEDFKLIRDLAIDASSQNIDEAITLMERAKQLNPKGPIINNKLNEFINIRDRRLASGQ